MEYGRSVGRLWPRGFGHTSVPAIFDVDMFGRVRVSYRAVGRFRASWRADAGGVAYRIEIHKECRDFDWDEKVVNVEATLTPTDDIPPPLEFCDRYWTPEDLI